MPTIQTHEVAGSLTRTLSDRLEPGLYMLKAGVDLNALTALGRINVYLAPSGVSSLVGDWVHLRAGEGIIVELKESVQVMLVTPTSTAAALTISRVGDHG